MSSIPYNIAAKAGKEHSTTPTADQKGYLFDMFYLPSSHSYNADFALARSSFGASTEPLSRAASAVMGGVWSALDAALAVLNEEFENPPDSMVSDEVNDNDGRLQERGDTCGMSTSGDMLCCRQTTSPKLSKSADGSILRSSVNGDKSSDKSDQSITGTENNSCSAGVEQSGLQKKDNGTPQISLIGSISTLQLYDECTIETEKIVVSDKHSKMTNTMGIVNKADSIVCTDSMGPKSEICKIEEFDNSEYCIVRNESETNDGWLVVSDD